MEEQSQKPGWLIEMEKECEAIRLEGEQRKGKPRTYVITGNIMPPLPSEVTSQAATNSAEQQTEQKQ